MQHQQVGAADDRAAPRRGGSNGQNSGFRNPPPAPAASVTLPRVWNWSGGIFGGTRVERTRLRAGHARRRTQPPRPARHWRPLHRRRVGRAGFTAGQTLLDVGCGPGLGVVRPLAQIARERMIRVSRGGPARGASRRCPGPGASARECANIANAQARSRPSRDLPTCQSRRRVGALGVRVRCAGHGAAAQTDDRRAQSSGTFVVLSTWTTARGSSRLRRGVQSFVTEVDGVVAREV